MSKKFYCNHKECKKAYYFDVPDEIMIDENNMGAFFCPFCSGQLMRSELPTNFNKYNIFEGKVPNNDF
jgi:hypothetical protein